MPVGLVEEPAAPKMTNTREPVSRTPKATEGSTNDALNLALVLVVVSCVAVFAIGYSVRKYHV